MPFPNVCELGSKHNNPPSSKTPKIKQPDFVHQTTDFIPKPYPPCLDVVKSELHLDYDKLKKLFDSPKISELQNKNKKTCFLNGSLLSELNAPPPPPSFFINMFLAPFIGVSTLFKKEPARLIHKRSANHVPWQTCVEEVKNDANAIKSLFYLSSGQVSELTQLQESAEHFLKHNKNASWIDKAFVFTASVIIHPFDVGESPKEMPLLEEQNNPPPNQMLLNLVIPKLEFQIKKGCTPNEDLATPVSGGEPKFTQPLLGHAVLEDDDDEGCIGCRPR